MAEPISTHGISDDLVTEIIKHYFFIILIVKLRKSVFGQIFVKIKSCYFSY